MAFLRGQDLWRRHPIFQWGWKDLLPGIREGAGLFVAYVAAEWTYNTFMAKPAAHRHIEAPQKLH